MIDATIPSQPTLLDRRPSGAAVLADCSAVILAGGYSTRFGSEKASAVWRGQTLLTHLDVRLRGAVAEQIAVARPEQQTGAWPVDRVVCDAADLPAGPLRGMVAGLSRCDTPYAYVLSCDAPLVQVRLLAALRAHLPAGERGILSEWEGRPQPLVSLWSREAVPALTALLRGGERSPRRAARALGLPLLPEAACRAADPEGWSFFNLNTPADIRALEASVMAAEVGVYATT